MECLKYGRKSNQYNDAIRSFAFTVHFYSPRAYQFIRNKFGKHLPDISCIRSWVSNCTGFSESGISGEALRALGTLRDEMNANGEKFYCSLSFDEMSIRRHVQWNEAQKKFLGFISFGKKDEDEQIPVARQALTFLITGINANISIPVAYFFIKSLSGTEKSILIKEILKEVTKVGANIINITFDGLRSNFTACRMLGASFTDTKFEPFFYNPIDRTKIHISLDACHMLKLIRNRLAIERVLEDNQGNQIEWRYFENLEKYRVGRNFVTHKLTKKHTEWTKNKMCVRFAAQLFSNSVADSLKYLSERNCDGFEHSGATSNFVRLINNLFDVFNSTDVENKTKNVFKMPLKPETSRIVFAFLDDAESYLRSIKLNGRNILTTDKCTGFKGFLIDIVNLKSLYHLYVETGLLKNIPTYQLSQDPLEALFGRIRSLNGNNDNPNVTQFTSALRKLLIKNEITSSSFANCADKLKIMTVSSRRVNDDLLNFPNNITLQTIEMKSDENEGFEHAQKNENDFLMDNLEEATIACIAGKIEKKIQESGRFECNCQFVLSRNERVNDLMISTESYIPCISTLYVCKVANINFNLCRNQIAFNYDILVQNIIDSFDFKDIYTDFFECDLSHKMGFVKYITEEFIRLQATYIAKNLTLVEQKLLCSKLLKKKAHFLGQ